MHAFDPTVSHYNGHMLRNLSKYYLFICCKQSSSTHFCHFLATTFVTDVLMGSNPSAMGPKKKGLHRWRPNNSVVGDEGCPRAAGAARAPLRRSAPRVLRWKTLARFLSSAPLRVRIPLRWAHTKTVPFRGPFPIRWWAMRDSNPQPCACKAPALTVAPIARAERV